MGCCRSNSSRNNEHDRPHILSQKRVFKAKDLAPTSGTVANISGIGSSQTIQQTSGAVRLISFSDSQPLLPLRPSNNFAGLSVPFAGLWSGTRVAHSGYPPSGIPASSWRYSSGTPLSGSYFSESTDDSTVTEDICCIYCDSNGKPIKQKTVRNVTLPAYGIGGEQFCDKELDGYQLCDWQDGACPESVVPCSGSATYTFHVKVDATQITNIIRSAIAQALEDPHLQDFLECKYPPDFDSKCPRDLCDVVIGPLLVSRISIPEIASSSQQGFVIKSCEESGTITSYEIFFYRFDRVMESLGNKLSDKISNLIKRCACPPGSAIVISVDVTKMYIVWGLLGRQIGNALDYSIEVKCIGGIPNAPNVGVDLIITKQCYPKEPI